MARRLFWCRRAEPDCSSGIFFAAAWVHVAVLKGSSWSARSRGAARTNELEAAQRRRIIGSGEDPCCAGCEGVVVHPRPGWRSGLASTHPAPRERAGGCHDHVSGDRAAQSDDRARRWRRLMPQERECPGLGDPPVVTAATVLPCRWPACWPAGARRGSGACGRSRWWRSSSRGVSRCLGRWRRTPGIAWRSAPPGS